MKKTLFLVLALALVLSLSVPALAAEVSTDNGSRDVTATYVDDTAIIYGVEITWGSMKFTYTSSQDGWNTESHRYGSSTGAWTYEQGANVVTVTNHSNAGIDVTPSWTADSGYADVSMTFDHATLSLATADNGVDGAAGTATSGKITVTPSGELPKDTNGKIGTITLTIDGKGNESTVTPAEELKNNLNTGGTVTLTGDITSGDTIQLESGVNSTLDLSGYYLNADVEINQGDDTSLTINDSGADGKVRHLSVKSGYLTLLGGTVEERVDVSGSASFSMNDGTVNGGIYVDGEGAVNMNDGTVNGGIYVDGESTATINSGIINSDDVAIKNTGGIVTIVSGTFDGDIDTSGDDSWTMIYNGTFSGDIVCYGGEMDIRGGTFSGDPSDYVDTGFYDVILNDDGTYTVKAI